MSDLAMSDKKLPFSTDPLEGLSLLDKALKEIDGTVITIDRALGQVEKLTASIDSKYTQPVQIEEQEVTEQSDLNIKYVDVVLREDSEQDVIQCRDSEKYDGLMFCFSDGEMMRYRYDPKVFEKATGAELGPLQEKIDDCPQCQVPENEE